MRADGGGKGIERGKGGGDGLRWKAVGGKHGLVRLGLRGGIRCAGGGDEFLLVFGDRAGDAQCGAVGGGGKDGAGGLAEIVKGVPRGGFGPIGGGNGLLLPGERRLTCGKSGLGGLLQVQPFGKFGRVIAARCQEWRDFGVVAGGFDELTRMTVYLIDLTDLSLDLTVRSFDLTELAADVP